MTSPASRAVKPQDALVEVILVDPLTLPLARLVAKSGLSPLAITVGAFLSRMGGALAVIYGHNYFFGALVFAGLMLDGLDGKVARIQRNRVRYHGMMDFVLDQVAFATIGAGLVASGVRYDRPWLSIAGSVWLAAYLILMALTSTWFRILADAGVSSAPGLGTKAFLQGKSATSLKSRLANWRATVRKSRIVPYPTTIEASFLAFIVAPFCGAYMPLIVLIGAAMFLPEIALQFMRITYLERALPEAVTPAGDRN